MGLDNITLAAAKSYIKQSLQGAGALKGQKGDPGKDGKDAPTIIGVNVDENNILSIKLSDGSVLYGGVIKIDSSSNISSNLIATSSEISEMIYDVFSFLN